MIMLAEQTEAWLTEQQRQSAGGDRSLSRSEYDATGSRSDFFEKHR